MISIKHNKIHVKIIFNVHRFCRFTAISNYECISKGELVFLTDKFHKQDATIFLASWELNMCLLCFTEMAPAGASGVPGGGDGGKTPWKKPSGPVPKFLV